MQSDNIQKMRSNLTNMMHEGDILKFQCLNSKALYPTGQEYQTNYILMTMFDLTLAPIAFLLNLFVLLVLAKYPILRTVPNCILISLAFSDMITGLFIQPMKATITALIMHAQYNCVFYLTALQLGYLMGMTSYLSLTLMAVERYVAIFHPFWYQKITSNKRVVIIPLLAIWLFSIMIMGLSFLTPQMGIMRLFVIALIPTSILWTAFVYIKVTLLIKKMNSQIASVSNVDVEGRSMSAAFTIRERRNTSITDGRPADESHPIEGSHADQQKGKITKTGLGGKEASRNRVARSRSNSKATRLVIIIMITVCLCYIPSCVLTFLRDYAKLEFLWVKGVHDWGTSFVLLNSTLNPIIYCLKLKDMRAKMKLMICGWWEQCRHCKTSA